MLKNNFYCREFFFVLLIFGSIDRISSKTGGRDVGCVLCIRSARDRSPEMHCTDHEFRELRGPYWVGGLASTVPEVDTPQVPWSVMLRYIV